MLKNEAIWIGKKVKKIKANSILDIGGGSWFFRNIKQYWIEKYIFSDLRNKNVYIVHTGIENDVCSKKFVNIGKFDLVMANNLLEHVKNIRVAVKNISKVVKKGGFLCVSVPSSFPYHPSPIDNMFRPNLEELGSLFKGFKVMDKKNIKEKMLLGVNRSSIFWINKRNSVSCLILKKT